MNNKSESSGRAAPGKSKQYARPSLVKYGDISAITRSTDMGKMDDGGAGKGSDMS